MEFEVEMIEVTVNGERRRIDGGRSVEALLDTLGLHPRLIVVEHNREILDRAQYASVEVRAGDTLELVHFVGGG
jgi:thiamine biosynthesis protein ThiS